MQYEVLKVKKPLRGYCGDAKDMLDRPTNNTHVKAFLQHHNVSAIVSAVATAEDKVRLIHEEWLLAGDGDVSAHKYVQVNGVIYSIVWVEY